jgi:pimeloyl-ACP methyl ester carboxylesterase
VSDARGLDGTSRAGLVPYVHPVAASNLPLMSVSDADLDDLRRRLRATRWPLAWPTPEWEAGTSATELRRLVGYWADGYRWRVHEAAINQLPSYCASVAGHTVHYLRFEAERSESVPILLTNGWPSSFLELTELAARLAAPSRFGLPADVCFTVVVPSLPGFTFSAQRPSLPSDHPTHELWHRLMRDELGAERFVAHGGDLGAGITSRLAAAHPESLIGIHLLAAGSPAHYDEATLSDEERQYLVEVARWTAEEGAYAHQQSTRPLTLSYGLADSPAGLLAWIVEKYRAWSDCDGTLANSFTDDFLLTQASLYWFTNTISTSFRPYYEYGRTVPRELDPVTVPTGLALFPKDLNKPPRSWAERVYNIVRYNQLPRGGHFAAIEEPDLLAVDIFDFVGSLLRQGEA